MGEVSGEEAVEGYERRPNCHFIISASKTPRLVEALKGADWKPSAYPDADGQCKFLYQPEGWAKAYRFVAVRYEKVKDLEPGQPEQYQLFEAADYIYRAFLTNM